MKESIKIKQTKVDVFNKLNPVGSRVTLIGDFGDCTDTEVNHVAQLMGGHTAVVWLKGIVGCYALDRVIGGMPVPPEGSEGRSWCPKCGPNVMVDEDGCCLGCESEATGDGADVAHIYRDKVVGKKGEGDG